jgi:hypothetical protein
MRLRNLVMGIGLAAMSSLALASHCPKDMKKIDETLATNPALSAAQMDEVKKLRAEGETLHKAGKHKESEEALGKALNILNTK